MHFTFVAATGLFALSSLTAAIPVSAGTCLDDAHAQQVAENFRILITDYSNYTASQVLCENFVDYSDSVNELINSGCPNGTSPLGSPTFTDRNNFEAGQDSQPNIPFEILNIWHGCGMVAMRWRSPNPGTVTPEQQVTGLIIMEVTFNGWTAEQRYLIQNVYSEFNSGAWLYDLGVFQPSCTAEGAATNATSNTTASTLTKRFSSLFPAV